MVWYLLPFKYDLVLGKARSCRAPNLGCRGAESPGWFDVSPKNSTWNVMHEWAHSHDKAANHQFPIAVAFWIIWIVSMEECSSLMQNLMQSLLQIHCSTCSHFECNSHTVHIFTQWHLLPPLTSTVKSSLFTHVHSSLLPLAARLHQCHVNCSHYINNGWTISRQTSYKLKWRKLYI